MRTKNKDDRVVAAKRVRRYLEQESRSRSQESFARVLQAVIEHMESWKKTPSSTDSLACTILIHEIVQMPHPEVKKSSIQVVVVNLLTRIVQQEASGRIPSSDSSPGLVALESACHVLGNLATGPASVTSFFVERETEKALEWLSAKSTHEMKRFAAVLMLKEFALNAPTLFNIRSDHFFANIYSALCDKHPRIRFTAAIALRYALRVIAQREARQKYKLYNDIWELARKQFPEGNGEGNKILQKGSDGVAASSTKSRPFSKSKRSSGKHSGGGGLFSFISGGSGAGSTVAETHDTAASLLDFGGGAGHSPFRSASAVHGALLGLYELIGECTGEFIQFRFEEIFNHCIWLQDVRLHNDPLVREAVMMILPRLALHSPDEGTFKIFMSQSLDYLIFSASSSGDPGPVYNATGSQNRYGIQFPTRPSANSTASGERVRSGMSTGGDGNGTAPVDSMRSSGSANMNGDGSTVAPAKPTRVAARHAAFRALGQISTLNKSALMFEHRLSEIMETIRDGLTPTPKWPFCSEALYCLRLILQSHDIVKVLGSTEILQGMIPNLFSGGLSEPLVSTLSVLRDNLADDVIVLQARLLQEVTSILSISAVRGGKKNRAFQQHVQDKQLRQAVKLASSGQLESSALSSYISRRDDTVHMSARSTRDDGSAKNGESGSTMRDAWKDFKWRATNLWNNTGTGNANVLKSKLEKDVYSDTDPSAQLQILALRTLSSFKFEGIDLIPILVSVVTRHLDATDPRVRMEACRATGYILSRALAKSSNVWAEPSKQVNNPETSSQSPEAEHRLSDLAFGIHESSDGEEEQRRSLKRNSRQQVPLHRRERPSSTRSSMAADRDLNGHLSEDEGEALDMHAVHHVLARLVMVAMTDDDVALRQFVIEDMAQRFTPILMKDPEFVRSFMVLANDRNFEVRAVAVDALGCFASQAPSSIMPSVHVLLLRHLNELNFAVEPKQREESVVLLGLLIRSLEPALARPHISTIINTLLPKIHRVHKGVATAMLATLGEVARVGDEATLSPLLARVLPIIVAILEDGSSSTYLKREVALSTLAIMASNAALPVWPYFCFPQLLDSILRTMVMPGAPPELRKQAMITYGVLGALDPWLYNNHQQLVKESNSGADSENTAFLPKMLLAFGGSRDLPTAVVQAFAARRAGSDDEEDGSDSEAEAEIDSEDEFADTGSGFEVDGNGAGLSHYALHASSGSFDGLRSGSSRHILSQGQDKLDRSNNGGSLWGTHSRKTSFHVKSELYPPNQVPPTSQNGNNEINRGVSSRSVTTIGVSEPTNLDPSRLPNDLSFKPISRSSSGHLSSLSDMPPLPPPPPPPPFPPPPDVPHMSFGKYDLHDLHGHHNLFLSHAHANMHALDDTLIGNGAGSSAVGSYGGANVRLGMHGTGQSSRRNLPMFLNSVEGSTSAANGGNGAPFYSVQHRRATVAHATFQDTLTRKVQSKTAAARALNVRGSRSRRKSSIRVVAQQINVLSHATKTNRRRSTLYQIQQGPPRSVGAENIGSKPGDHSFAASAANMNNIASPANKSTVMHGPGPKSRTEVATAATTGNVDNRVAPLDEFHGMEGSWRGPNGTQMFFGAAAYAAAAANQQIQDQLADDQVESDLLGHTSANAILPCSVKMSAEYYPRVAITALAKVLTRSKMEHEEHLMTAIEAINRVFKALESNYALFLPLVMPRLIHVIQRAASSGRSTTDKKLQELCVLVRIVEQDITPYVPAIFELTHEIWGGNCKPAIVELTQVIVATLPADALRPHMATLLDDMLSFLHSERDALQFVDSVHILHVLAHFKTALDEHLYLVVPTLAALVDSTLVPLNVRTLSVETLTSIICSCNISEYASLIVHPLVHALEDCRARSTSQTIQQEELPPTAPKPTNSRILRNIGERNLFIWVMKALNALVFRLEEEFAVYTGMVERALGEIVASGLLMTLPNSPHSTTGIVGQEGALIESYLAIINRVLRGQSLARPSWCTSEDVSELLYLQSPSKTDQTRHIRTQSMVRAHSMDLSQLKPAWHTAQISTEDEWLEWMRRFALALLRQSPIEAIYVCYPLAQVYEPVANELFNAAFLSCWDNLENSARDNLVDQIELALKSPKIPKDLLQVFLNLVDFMEHDDKPLPIDIRVLSNVAIRCQANAKALRFKELEFRTVPEDCIEKLININNNLEMHHAAAGVVLYARSHFSETTEVKPLWYERLQKWDEALHAYDHKLQQLDRNIDSRYQATRLPVKEQLNLNIGRLRCLNKVGGWNTVLTLLDDHWGELRDIDFRLGQYGSVSDASIESPISRPVMQDPFSATGSNSASSPIGSPPVQSHFLPKFRGSTDHMSILDPALQGMEIPTGRRRSLDEGPSSAASTLGQPIGVLMRHRSHASSSVVSYTTDEDLSESRLGAIRTAYEDGVSHDIHDLMHLFGKGTNGNDIEDRIYSSMANQPLANAPQPLPGLSAPNNTGYTVPDEAYIGAVKATSPFELNSTDALSPVSRDINDYYRGLGAFSKVVTNQIQNARAKQKEPPELSGYTQEVSQRSGDLEQSSESDLRWYAQKLATIGGLASYALGKWENMSRFSPYWNTNRTDGCMLNVILALREDRLEHAQRFIDRAYAILDKALSSLVTESYNRAYPHLIQVQHMVELQEILDYKKLLRQENHEEVKLYMNRLRRVWSSRLQGVQDTTSSYMLILAYRCLIVDPIDDLDTWLHFAKIARKENLLNVSLQALMRLGIGSELLKKRYNTHEKVSVSATQEEHVPSIITLLDIEDNVTSDFQYFQKEDMAFHLIAPSERGRARLQAHNFRVKPRVAFAYIKYIWATGEHIEAIHRLRRLRIVLLRYIEADHPLELAGQESSTPNTSFMTGYNEGTGPKMSGSTGLDAKLGSSNHSMLKSAVSVDDAEEEEGGDVFETDSRADFKKGDQKLSLNISELDQLRAEMHAADDDAADKYYTPRLEETDEDLEQFFWADLHALNISFDRKHVLRKLLVQCSNKLGSWLVAINDKQQHLTSHSRVDGPGPSSPVSSPLHSRDRKTLQGQNWQQQSMRSTGGASQRRISPPSSPERSWSKQPRALRGRSRQARMSITTSIHNSFDSSGARPGSMLLRNPIHLEQQSAQVFSQVLQCYRAATELDPNNYKAWHAWALANFRVSVSPNLVNPRSNGVEETSEGGVNDALHQDRKQHVVPAIKGFFRSIALGRHSGADVLQDILRLLTLWFSHFDNRDVERAIREGFSTLDIDAWLGVIPQLIARLKTRGDLVCELLLRIGEAHPQYLIYPLTVALKSDDSPARADAAKYVMRGLRDLYPELADEASIVSRELTRIAVLWHEKWYNLLEDASRAYFSEKPDIAGMVSILIRGHEEMESGAQTLHDVAFVQAYGLDLQEASEWLYRFVKSGNKNKTFLDQAWDLYYGVFRMIKQQLQHKSMELRNVSPILLQARDLQLAVPGTYQVGAPVTRIARFEPSVRIISSKQRPRVITIVGSDGFSHMFLLKGNEDLRMDERVMQLFGLVNGLLHLDEDTSKLGLEIQRYAVVPLPSTSGIVEWVPQTDTLHRLIEEYRESRNIPVQIEQKLMNELSSRYDELTVMQKVEILEYALNNTSGQDLARILWLKSPNSEVWIQRRTNYTRSLAAMSMVGYILGLGDRHPSNLMLERNSGRILHIDFGDCFEVTMHRENFPETVPFRLTRMLVKAMEASGLDGTFRHTCHAVMHVLRENHESILTMLEAFVYDPLVSWRILHPDQQHQVKDDELEAQSNGESGAGNSFMATTESSVPLLGGEVDSSLNQRAVDIIDRVRSKLYGTDFHADDEAENSPLTVKQQVEKLINQATSHENLAQLYRGWSACW